MWRWQAVAGKGEFCQVQRQGLGVVARDRYFAGRRRQGRPEVVVRRVVGPCVAEGGASVNHDGLGLGGADAWMVGGRKGTLLSKQKH